MSRYFDLDSLTRCLRNMPHMKTVLEEEMEKNGRNPEALMQFLINVCEHWVFESKDVRDVTFCHDCKYFCDTCTSKNKNGYCSDGQRKSHDEKYVEVDVVVFEDFIKKYGRPLEAHGIYFCSPPIIMYLEHPKYHNDCVDYCGSFIVAEETKEFMGSTPHFFIDKGEFEKYKDRK